MRLPFLKLIKVSLIFLIVFFPGPGGSSLARESLADSASLPLSTPLLTLERAKQIALEKSPTLAAARERIFQARQAIVQARADYLPTLSASATWAHTQETQSTLPSYNENQYTHKISATQVLFDGFLRKYTTLAATYTEKMSFAGQEEAKRLLSWSVAQSFLNAQLTFEYIKISESDILFNQKQETEALAKERAGTGSLSDVLNFKTRVNSAKSSLIGFQQDLKEALYGLAALLGYETAVLPREIKIAPLATQTQPLPLGKNQISNIQALLDQRPDLKQAWLAIKNADAKIDMAKSEYFPEISLTAAYGATNLDNLNDIIDSDTMGGSLGININFEFFSGSATQSRIREATSVKRELEKNLAAEKITAVSDIKSAAENKVTSQEKLKLQQENTDLIQTTRNLVEKEYTAGQVSLVRLNEVQNNLVTAMGNLAIARASLILAQERFDYYTGNNVN